MHEELHQATVLDVSVCSVSVLALTIALVIVHNCNNARIGIVINRNCDRLPSTIDLQAPRFTKQRTNALIRMSQALIDNRFYKSLNVRINVQELYILDASDCVSVCIFALVQCINQNCIRLQSTRFTRPQL